jgi:hypothetical protein
MKSGSATLLDGSPSFLIPRLSYVSPPFFRSDQKQLLLVAWFSYGSVLQVRDLLLFVYVCHERF